MSRQPGGDLSGYQRQKCRARSKRTGEQCGAYAEPGATVCRWHGAAAPQVRAKAELRLAALVDPAIEILAQIMAAGEKDVDRLRAADSILDRAGYGRAQKISVQDARMILLERIEQVKAERYTTEPADDEAEVVEGELLD